jgi:hypothetical protein
MDGVGLIEIRLACVALHFSLTVRTPSSPPLLRVPGFNEPRLLEELRTGESTGRIVDGYEDQENSC